LFIIQQIVKLDVRSKATQLWRDSPTAFPGEPVFVPNSKGAEEDDGYILSTVLETDDDKPHFLLILDAKSWKEVARVEFPRDSVEIPPTIHGIFRSDDISK
jgi:carotenoid cleavage dioxygenase-like enzyme